MYEVQKALEDCGEYINILAPSRKLVREGAIGYVPSNKVSSLITSSPKVKEGYPSTNIVL